MPYFLVSPLNRSPQSLTGLDISSWPSHAASRLKKKLESILEKASGGKALGVTRYRWTSEATYLFIWLFRVFCEEVFTTEAPSAQRSENFLIKNSSLRVRAFSQFGRLTAS